MDEEAKNPGPARQKSALAALVRQSGQSRHDRALSRALSQLRPHRPGASLRQADHRHRADRLGSVAVQPPSSGAGQARARRHPRRRRHRLRSSPCHPIQETGKRPTAALDRNLAYLSLVEVLYGYPLDGVVLTTGCDKTTPARIMAAATVNIPAIVLSGGPMLNGWWKGERAGSGTAIWKAREETGRRAASTTRSSWTSRRRRRRRSATATPWAPPRP